MISERFETSPSLTPKIPARSAPLLAFGRLRSASSIEPLCGRRPPWPPRNPTFSTRFRSVASSLTSGVAPFASGLAAGIARRLLLEEPLHLRRKGIAGRHGLVEEVGQPRRV